MFATAKFKSSFILGFSAREVLRNIVGSIKSLGVSLFCCNVLTLTHCQKRGGKNKEIQRVKFASAVGMLRMQRRICSEFYMKKAEFDGSELSDNDVGKIVADRDRIEDT